jgi:hypothetical protein
MREGPAQRRTAGQIMKDFGVMKGLWRYHAINPS